MGMVWILVKDGVVINRIVADQEYIDQIKPAFDKCLEIDGAKDGTTCGYIEQKDGSFLPPEEVPPDPQEAVQELQQKLQELKDAIVKSGSKVDQVKLDALDQLAKDIGSTIEPAVKPAAGGAVPADPTPAVVP